MNSSNTRAEICNPKDLLVLLSKPTADVLIPRKALMSCVFILICNQSIYIYFLGDSLSDNFVLELSSHMESLR